MSSRACRSSASSSDLELKGVNPQKYPHLQKCLVVGPPQAGLDDLRRFYFAAFAGYFVVPGILSAYIGSRRSIICSVAWPFPEPLVHYCTPGSTPEAPEENEGVVVVLEWAETVNVNERHA